MGNHDIGRTMAAAAEVFWLMVPPEPTKDQALAALEAAGEPFRGGDAEFDDELRDGVSTPLGRLVALAFDATPEELSRPGNEDENPWYDGPYSRFREHFDFC